MTKTDTITRIRAEFLEMPGMRLTSDQIQRLCGVDAEMCDDAIAELVRTKFLTRLDDGTYARTSALSATRGPMMTVPGARPASLPLS